MPQPNFSIDLHLHTTASDGALSPRQVLEEAQWRGVSAVAITDHDTVSGLAASFIAGKELGIEVIAGVELSCRHNNREVHLLGLLIEPDDEFTALLEHLRKCRETRMGKMLENLRRFNIHLTFNDLKTEPGQAFGRPHLARALLERKLVRSINEAFDRYLGDTGPVYVEREHLSVIDALAIINRIKGISILAHPGVSNIAQEQIHLFAKLGLHGVESHYPQHSPALTESFSDLCRKYDLLESGGSDFHTSDRNIGIGTPYTPYSFLTKIKAKKETLWAASLVK